MKDELLTKLNLLAKDHDWYYDYSDDYSVWRKAKDIQDQIDKLVQELKSLGYYKEAVDVISQYCSAE